MTWPSNGIDKLVRLLVPRSRFIVSATASANAPLVSYRSRRKLVGVKLHCACLPGHSRGTIHSYSTSLTSSLIASEDTFCPSSSEDRWVSGRDMGTIRLTTFESKDPTPSTWSRVGQTRTARRIGTEVPDRAVNRLHAASSAVAIYFTSTPISITEGLEPTTFMKGPLPSMIGESLLDPHPAKRVNRASNGVRYRYLRMVTRSF